MKQKVLSIILAVAMVVTSMVTAFAAEPDNIPDVGEEENTNQISLASDIAMLKEYIGYLEAGEFDKVPTEYGTDPYTLEIVVAVLEGVDAGLDADSITLPVNKAEIVVQPSDISNSDVSAGLAIGAEVISDMVSSDKKDMSEDIALLRKYQRLLSTGKINEVPEEFRVDPEILAFVESLLVALDDDKLDEWVDNQEKALNNNKNQDSPEVILVKDTLLESVDMASNVVSGEQTWTQLEQDLLFLKQCMALCLAARAEDMPDDMQGVTLDTLYFTYGLVKAAQGDDLDGWVELNEQASKEGKSLFDIDDVDWESFLSDITLPAPGTKLEKVTVDMDMVTDIVGDILDGEQPTDSIISDYIDEYFAVDTTPKADIVVTVVSDDELDSTKISDNKAEALNTIQVLRAVLPDRDSLASGSDLAAEYDRVQLAEEFVALGYERDGMMILDYTMPLSDLQMVAPLVLNAELVDNYYKSSDSQVTLPVVSEKEIADAVDSLKIIVSDAGYDLTPEVLTVLDDSANTYVLLADAVNTDNRVALAADTILTELINNSLSLATNGEIGYRTDIVESEEVQEPDIDEFDKIEEENSAQGILFTLPEVPASFEETDEPLPAEAIEYLNQLYASVDDITVGSELDNARTRLALANDLSEAGYPNDGILILDEDIALDYLAEIVPEAISQVQGNDSNITKEVEAVIEALDSIVMDENAEAETLAASPFTDDEITDAERLNAVAALSESIINSGYEIDETISQVINENADIYALASRAVASDSRVARAASDALNMSMNTKLARATDNSIGYRSDVNSDNENASPAPSASPESTSENSANTNSESTPSASMIPTDATTTDIKIENILASESGADSINAEKSVKLVDTVSLTGLTTGKTYSVRVYLVDESGADLKINGSGVKSEVKFTATSTKDIQQVVLTLDATELAGKKIGARAELYEGSQKIASTSGEVNLIGIATSGGGTTIVQSNQSNSGNSNQSSSGNTQSTASPTANPSNSQSKPTSTTGTTVNSSKSSNTGTSTSSTSKTNSTKSEGIAKTGDEVNTIGWICGVAAGVALIIGLYVFRKRLGRGEDQE